MKLEKIEKATDEGEAFVALSTDLSKAFNCLLHYLIITKLNP